MTRGYGDQITSKAIIVSKDRQFGRTEFDIYI